MRKKIFNSIGLMSGTSMDGIDLSVIKSDGVNIAEPIINEYYEFDQNLFNKLTDLRSILKNTEDLTEYSQEIETVERDFTLFHAKIIKEIIEKKNLDIDIVGFHGQTILHLPHKKISKQLGDGNLLSQLIKCKVVNKFRQKDLSFGGQGAPLTPIYHFLISKLLNDKFNIDYPINIINIGGITNISKIFNSENIENNLFAYDIGPGNCMIDEWIRKNTNQKFDKDGILANSGKTNQLILNQAIDNFKIKSIENSMDINNFDISFIRGLGVEEGCATITEFTAYLISEGIKISINKDDLNLKNFFISGGGRKNKYLVKKINKFLNDYGIKLENIDQFNINGDFIESQAFAYLAIRSYLDLPISFPNTTRCTQPITGGIINNNF
ncbi:anhydro-N-acetylmuramic acid kinase [Candidatus Pelagibacter sp.]|nr:anhydro-N-acetylmuramic acid kinase [Candidatus Pelagibacter sp.]